MEFIDFDVTLCSAGERLVVSTNQAQGIITKVTNFPLSAKDIQLLRATVQAAAAATAGQVGFRAPATDSERLFRQQGSEIFKEVFQGEILEEFRFRYKEARARGYGLRIRVTTSKRDAVLGAYPYELMYCEQPIGAHVALFGGLTVVRSLQGQRYDPRGAVTPPLKILIVGASPLDWTPIPIQEEVEKLEQALSLPGIQRPTKVVSGSQTCTMARVINIAKQVQPHVLHFIGHGQFDEESQEGSIVLETSNRKGAPISAEDLKGEIAHLHELRLVTLNCCLGTLRGADADSAIATSIFSLGIPGVVAMQFRVSNSAAMEFAKNFYGEIALGRAVDEAMTSARMSVRREIKNSPEWAAPVLYLGAAKGDLFGLRLPAEQLIVHAKAALGRGQWEVVRTICRLAQEQYSQDPPVEADLLIRMSEQAEEFLEQWKKAKEFADHGDRETLEETLERLFKLASDLQDLPAESLKSDEDQELGEIIAAAAIVREFEQEKYPEVIDHCKNATASKLIDLSFLKDKAAAERAAVEAAKASGQAWDAGNWSAVLRRLRRADFKGTRLQRALERRSDLADEIAKAANALSAGDFKRSFTILEHIPVAETNIHIRIMKEAAALGSRISAAAEVGAWSAIAQLENDLEELRQSASANQPGVSVNREVFLCYAREDKDKVKGICADLARMGFKPWRDEENLLPAQEWEEEIEKAIRRCDFFLACLSPNSVDRRGVLQKEIRIALDVWREKLDGDIYLIPARIAPCDVPAKLSRFQWVDLFEEGGLERLKKALQYGADRLTEPRPSQIKVVPGETEIRRRIQELKEESEFQQAKQLYDQGRFQQALEAFKKLDGYKDSLEMAGRCELWVNAGEALENRNWQQGRAFLDKLSIREKNPRIQIWRRWCTQAPRIIPALETVSRNTLVYERAIPHEGADSPYKVFATYNITPQASKKDCDDAGFAAQGKPGGMSQAERVAWDALRLVPSRLCADFTLYTVKDPERAARLLEHACTVDEGADPGLTTQKAVEELGDDAGVFLALLKNYDQAIEFLLRQAKLKPLDLSLFHHLGLVAAAKINFLEANAGEYDEIVKTWEYLIVGWSPVFADDNFWNMWWASRRAIYRDPITSDQIQEVRLRLQRSWLDQLKWAPEIRSGLDAKFRAEICGARAVHSGGGIPLPDTADKGAVLGLLGVQVFGLADQLAKWAGSFNIQSLGEEGWQQRICRYFSELAEASALLEDGRNEDAIEALIKPRCHFQAGGDFRCRQLNLSEESLKVANASCPCFPNANPAFSGLQRGGELLLQSGCDLLEKAHSRIALEALSKSPVEIEKAITHWTAATEAARRRGRDQDRLSEIREVAIGRANFLASTEGERRMDALNDAIELLQSMGRHQWDNHQHALQDALVRCLLERAMHLSAEYDNEEDARQDALYAYSMAPHALSSISVLCQVTLHYAVEVLMRGQTKQADSLVVEVANRLQEGERLFPGNANLATVGEHLKEVRKVFSDMDGNRLSQVLERMRSSSEENGKPQEQSKLVEAMVAEAQRDFAKAIQLYTQLLEAEPNDKEIGTRMAFCYRSWIFHAQASGDESPEQVRAIASEALRRFPGADALSDIAVEFVDQAPLEEV